MAKKRRKKSEHPAKRAAAASAAPQATASRETSMAWWIAAGGIALLAALLQAYRIADPIRGFHGFNEGFYLLNGLKDLRRSVFAPLVSPLDVNNPWVYPLALAWTLRLLGGSIAAARALSVVASAASVVLVFAIGRKLYNERVGLIAAALFAFTPIEAIVGRNIQTDALMLAFELGALLCYLYAVSSERVALCVASGVLLALGVQTKLPAVLVLPALAVWQTWRTGGLGWVRVRSTWVTAATFGAVTIPWYVYRAVSFPAFTSAQGYLLGTGGVQRLSHFLDAVLVQWFWMMTPLVFLVSLVSIGWLIAQRQSADKLILSFIAVQAAFFLFYNFHAYYFLPLVPFCALAVGRAIYSILGTRAAWQVATVVAVCITLVLPFTVVELAAKKYSPLPLQAVVAKLKSSGLDPSRTRVYVDSSIAANEGPPVHLLAEQGLVHDVVDTTGDFYPDPAGMRQVVLSAGIEPSPSIEEIGVLTADIVSPVVFGYAIRELPGQYNFFTLAKPAVARVGPPWQFRWEHWPADMLNRRLYLLVGQQR